MARTGSMLARRIYDAELRVVSRQNFGKDIVQVSGWWCDIYWTSYADSDSVPIRSRW
jgi:hypothetical protein